MGDPVWDATARDADLRVLSPGIPDDVDRTPDVAVVGGGAVGLATAVMCRRAGVERVLVLERERLAAGPSGRAAGILSPELHVWTDPPAFVDLARTSLRMTRALDEEWDGALGVRVLDSLVADVGEIEAPAGAELLDQEALREYEPAVSGPDSALLFRDQARVHPLRLAAGFAKHAGTIATGVEVGKLRDGTLETSIGDIHPGAVIFATGIPPPGLVPVEHHVVKGHLAATEPVPFRLRSGVATAIGGALQLDDGRLLSGGTLDEGDVSPAVRPDVIDVIRRGLDSVIPAAADFPFSHRWCCFRPAAPDLQPIIDRVPGTANAWVTSGHYRTGLVMAAATGQALAVWLTTGSSPAEVQPFGLTRFG
jgi:glycine oxidase